MKPRFQKIIFNIFILTNILSTIVPTFTSAFLHNIYIRPITLIFLYKNIRVIKLKAIIIFSVITYAINFTYINNNIIEVVYCHLYLSLAVILYRIGRKKSKEVLFLSSNLSLTLYILVFIQCIVFFLVNFLPGNYADFLSSRGVEITRISFGNALESQITLTFLMYLLKRQGEKRTQYVMLVSNSIAQVRIMIVENILIIFSEYRKNMMVLFFSLAIALLILAGIGEFFDIERMRISDLISGGSTLDRINLMYFVVESMNYENILFGYGPASFVGIYTELFGISKSCESVILQVIFEYGIFGLAFIFIYLKDLTYKNSINIIIIIFIFQALFMMPINNMLPLQMLILGALMQENILSDR